MSAVHGSEVEFAAGASSARGYFARPAAGGGPATLVLQEWWGVDDHIRSVCDRLAGAGLLALAPDLYHGETPTHPDDAERLMMAMSMDVAVHEMCAAAAWLDGHEANAGRGVGALGFCLGGGLCLWAASACPRVAATVTYYYVLPHGLPDVSRVHGPVMGHFGTADEYVPLDDVAALERTLRDAGVTTAFHRYDGADHAFFNDSRPDAYDRESAERSWQRSTAFLRTSLVGGAAAR